MRLPTSISGRFPDRLAWMLPRPVGCRRCISHERRLQPLLWSRRGRSSNPDCHAGASGSLRAGRGSKSIWPGFSLAAAARIANALKPSACRLSVYYFLLVFPGKFRPLALVVGVSLTQFGTPLARLVPVEVLSIDHWQGMHCIELAVPLLVLAATLVLPLPPSDRVRAFEGRICSASPCSCRESY